jgi:hypothetical protein
MKIWKLLIPLSIIVLFIYLLLSGINEGFEVSNLIFKSKEEVQLFIINDKDDYIKNMTIYDLRARKVKSPEEYIKIIITNVLDFNDEQKNKLRRCSMKASEYFNNGKEWKFALISSAYEEGFPHTREDIIFLSPSILNYDDTIFIKTLIHESIHIYQRYNKKAIDEYMIKNGFEKIRRREKGEMIRANPDLDEFIYKDKKGIEMKAIYNSEYPNGIGDIKISHNMEHPYEFMAYEIAENYYKSLLDKYKEI